MMSQEVIRAHALTAVIEDRIHDLWNYHRWYQANATWAVGPEWDQMRAQDWLELRALVRLARKARDLSAPAVAYQEPSQPIWDFPPDTTYASMTESEARFAWGDR